MGIGTYLVSSTRPAPQVRVAFDETRFTMNAISGPASARPTSPPLSRLSSRNLSRDEISNSLPPKSMDGK
ncbi:hypothetical protein NL676_002975 [Syzygium grande]|nr:hypothetical protein NL676_002975 [Syzygium grande]